MGNEFIYVNLDAREQGIRYYARIDEDKLDPKKKLLRRLYDPNIITKRVFTEEEVLPVCSLDQRPHLGQLNIAAEIWDLILSHITDLISAACFGAAHPLLAHCALERMRDIEMSVEGVSAWAGHRIALINDTDSTALPREVYTATEWVEWDVEEKGIRHMLEKWPDVEGGPKHPVHGDEWTQYGGPLGRNKRIKSATVRWERMDPEKHGWRYRSDEERERDIDYSRVHGYLNYIEFIEIYYFHPSSDVDFVLCNESKREYVLAPDVAWFYHPCQFDGPDVRASWTLGDTAGFLVCWDVDGKCGRGEGPWAGDRIRITSFENMEAMGGTGEWTDIGGEDAQLWKDISAFLDRYFSYDDKTWKDNYHRVRDRYYPPDRGFFGWHI